MAAASLVSPAVSSASAYSWRAVASAALDADGGWYARPSCRRLRFADAAGVRSSARCQRLVTARCCCSATRRSSVLSTRRHCSCWTSARSRAVFSLVCSISVRTDACRSMTRSRASAAAATRCLHRSASASVSAFASASICRRRSSCSSKSSPCVLRKAFSPCSLRSSSRSASRRRRAFTSRATAASASAFARSDSRTRPLRRARQRPGFGSCPTMDSRSFSSASRRKSSSSLCSRSVDVRRKKISFFSLTVTARYLNRLSAHFGYATGSIFVMSLLDPVNALYPLGFSLGLSVS
mmetsp:Transcript_37782/g.116747  ORF Transcript_37782/g.116747 Transcript_37782/m.116747 type:complete len:295 (+) Transcript_37782:159-1043(+)